MIFVERGCCILRKPVASLGLFLTAFFAVVACGCSSGGPARVFDVRVHGAAGDGSTNDAAAIQRTIDEAAKAGGGTVRLGGGKTYRSGAIHLASGITLQIDKGTTLIASDRREDYEADPVLILADAAQNLTLSGEGVIEGGVKRFMVAELPHIYRPGPWRPMLLRCVRCKSIHLSGLTFHDSPSWCVHLAGCDDVTITGIAILNDLRRPIATGLTWTIAGTCESAAAGLNRGMTALCSRQRVSLRGPARVSGCG